MGPPRPGQVREALREEEEQVVHARAEEADGRAVSPDLVPLLAHSPLVLDPFQLVQPLELFLPLDVQPNLSFAGGRGKGSVRRWNFGGKREVEGRRCVRARCEGACVSGKAAIERVSFNIGGGFSVA